MKVFPLIVTGALCAATLPAWAGGVLLDFNNLPAGSNGFAAGSNYAGFEFSDAAWVVRSNQSGGNAGGFYTPDPAGGPNRNIGALTLITADPSAAQASLTVTVDGGFGGHFIAQVGALGLSDVFLSVFGKDGQALGSAQADGLSSGDGCDSNWVCNWTTLDIDLGANTAYSVQFTGTEGLAWFDNFEFGGAPGTGGGAVPEPAGLLLVGTGLLALAWSRRRSQRHRS